MAFHETPRIGDRDILRISAEETSMNTCSNHIGYSGEKWGVTFCGASPALDCTFCHKPACAKHSDSGDIRRKCMDCYEAENNAIRERAQARGVIAGKALQ